MRYILYFFGIIFSVLCIGVVAGLLYLYSEVRFDAYKIIEYKPNLSSQIFDKNGKLIANLYQDKHRFYASYDEIPPRLIEALVAIEDTAFFEHPGINIEAIFRAIIKDIQAMKLVEGASTITQQLIKNVALSPEKKLIRKLKEMVLAFKIENELSKERILEIYLNEVYFGHGYYGVKTAAKGYFHKELNALSLKEIAMLVGLPNAPSAYDPTKHLSLSLSRSNQVLGRMEKLGWISKDDYQKSVQEVPKVYDESLTQNQAPFIFDQVLRELNKQFNDIKTGGYNIYTTIDLRVQDMAKKSIKDGYINILKRNKYDSNDTNGSNINGSIIVMENKTGNILSLVGGVDYKQSSFNRAVQSKRQPGSSIKPFIYQIALDLGYSPASMIPDISRVYEDRANHRKWKPKNYSNRVSGLITLKDALIHSRNLATINLVTSLGLDTIHEKLSSLGFENVPMDLSISLGSFGISPLKYAKFYSAFANEGEMVEPKIVSKIEDRFGNVQEYKTKTQTFTTPEQAYLMIDMMRDVVNKGTGRRAKVKDIEIGGKTGTTNSNVDAWFCGYTPDITILVWYGRDDNKPMGKKDTGGVASAPVFKDFLTKYIELFPQTTRTFKKPKGVSFRHIGKEIQYFTDTSPLPKQSQIQNSQNANELLF